MVGIINQKLEDFTNCDNDTIAVYCGTLLVG
jgi:hypothetical protein